MLRWLVYTFTIGVFVSFVGGLVYFAPYHIYSIILEDGIESEYFKFYKRSNTLFQLSPFEFELQNGIAVENHKNWKPLHFGKYELMFPHKHPLYVFVPKPVQQENGKTLFGFEMQDSKGVVLGRFTPYGITHVNFLLSENKVFQVPYFKNYIAKKSEEDLWKDLFSKNLNIPHKLTDETYLDFVKKLSEIDVRELVYNLFILDMRYKIMPKNTEKISFFEAENKGVILLKDEITDKNYRPYLKEVVFIRLGDYLHEVLLETKNVSMEAESWRKKVLESLRYKPQQESSYVPLYSEFQKLGYEDRTDQVGLTYLYASWSHQEHNGDFLKEMIQYLERGRSNKIQLTALYEYAYRKYGTNFSANPEKIKEKEDLKLKRKIDEEITNELREENNREISNTDNFDNATREEKIKFLLKEAIEKGQNVDEDETKLIVN